MKYNRTEIRPGLDFCLPSRKMPDLPVTIFEELIETIAEQFGLLPKLICAGGRRQDISNARATIAYMAVAETGHSAADVARYLRVKESVLQALKKGKMLF